MIKVYRRPYRISLSALAALAALSALLLFYVESNPLPPDAPYFDEMRQAAGTAARLMAAVREERARKGPPISPVRDPAGSGLIGAWMTPVTSTYGDLGAKQTTVNPDFAALIVRLLGEAGVKKGDVVAAGFSGSFPALNLCVHAAVQALDLRPAVVAGLASSQWGANVPEFMWTDIEAALFDRGLIEHRADAVAPGGREDRGEGMSEEGLAMIRAAAGRHGYAMIDAASLSEMVDLRMAVYRRVADGRPIAAYINVGGAAASVGTKEDKLAFPPGLSTAPPPGGVQRDSIMSRFLREGVPVIHLSQIHVLARRYKMPWRPRETPAPGSGGVYGRPRYNPFLAAAALALMVAVTAGLVWREKRRGGRDVRLIGG